MTSQVADPRMVLRAIYELHERSAEWPTHQEIAAYLDADRRAVKFALLVLQDQRLFRERQRQRKKRWMPWSEA